MEITFFVGTQSLNIEAVPGTKVIIFAKQAIWDNNDAIYPVEITEALS